MKYIGNEHFRHNGPDLSGVLLCNLGTPERPDTRALRPYLRQFLSDPRVVELPRLLWWLILHGVILNTRPARSAKNYQQVWTDEGSPLLLHTRAQAKALQQRLKEQHGEGVLVDFAMRYGEPSIESAIQGMVESGVSRLLVLPLYPQYSGPTTGSTFDALARSFQRRRWLPQLQFVSGYCDHPAYIAALANSVRRHRKQHGAAKMLLFSYHGEPRSYLDKGDPYFCQCHKTTRLVAQALGLAQGSYRTVFQSRFGRGEWLQPYTDETLKTLPSMGVDSVEVICPGFAADCLETLEEIGVENRSYFMQAGGKGYYYIPCLNAGADHIEVLAQMVREQADGWLQQARDTDATLACYRALQASVASK